MAAVSSRSLQLRLLILVFLAFIPALGFFWYANGELRRLQMESKEQELVKRALVTSATYRDLLDQGRAYLASLSEISEIRDAAFPSCNELLRRLLPHMEHFTTISVIGLDGYLACGSMTPEDPLYLGDRAYFVRASTRSAFAVGEFSLGRITGRPVVGFALPVQRDGELARVLAASMDLNVLVDWTTEGPLPEGYTFTVLDRGGQVLVRRPVTGDFTLADSVGSMAGEGFPPPPEGMTPVVVRGTDLDGLERLFAVAPLRGPAGEAQGYIAFGRTWATIASEVDQVVDVELRYLALGGLILLVLAWALGHFWMARCPPGAEEG